MFEILYKVTFEEITAEIPFNLQKKGWKDKRSHSCRKTVATILLYFIVVMPCLSTL
jgi:hypothetical protein